MADVVGDLTKVVRKLSRENHRMVQVMEEILTCSKPSGSGGYWADYGPVTYARLVEFTENARDAHSDGSECGPVGRQSPADPHPTGST